MSWREFQILFYLRQGLNNKAIASKLGINQKTVSTYLARIKRKLGVGNANAYKTVIVAQEQNYFDLENVKIQSSQKEEYLYFIRNN